MSWPWPYVTEAIVGMTPADVVMTAEGEIEGVHLVDPGTGRMYEFVETVCAEDGARMDKWKLIETDKEPGGGAGAAGHEPSMELEKG